MGLHETLLHATETAFITVLQRHQQHQPVQAANQPRHDNQSDDGLAKNLFANDNL